MSDSALVWSSGSFVPTAEARVSARSASVGLGIGVFETLRIVNGQAPLMARHLARLRDSSARIGLDSMRWDFARVVPELAERNGLREGAARITLGEDLALVSTREHQADLAQLRRHGVSLRSARVAWPVPEVKHTSRMALWLAERQASGEVLLLGSGARLLETSRANLFCVRDGRLETAPVPRVLPGISRGLVLELARDLGVSVRQRAPRWPERSAWHEVFVTNAVRGVCPVIDIDGYPCPEPTAASLTRQIQKGLDQRMMLR